MDKILVLCFFLVVSWKAVGSDTIRHKVSHNIDFGIVGRAYFGHNGLKYENFDEGIYMRLGKKLGGPPFPFQPHLSFFYHHSYKKNTISLGWQYFNEIVSQNLSIKFVGYQLGYSYTLFDKYSWLDIKPKVIIPVSSSFSTNNFQAILVNVGLGFDIVLKHKSGITLRNELSIQNNYNDSLLYLQHQLCIGYKF